VVAPRNDPTPTPLLPTPMPEALRTQTRRRLVIPSIGVDGPIVAGDSWEDLKLGIGHHPGSANAGENGNVVLSAHDDVYGELFRYLYQVEPGAAVDIYGDEVVYHYQIRSVEIVAPTKIEVMAATTEPILTLITCYPYMLDTHRVVAVADYLGADPIEADAGDTGTTN
jgi:sortase A